MQIAAKFASDQTEMQPEVINGFRLSPQQGHLWLLQQETPAYRAQVAILLEGHLKTEVLRKALHRVISRHEILRTTFHSLPGMKIPVQVIADESAPVWRIIALGDRSPQDQAAEIENLFREDRSRPVDFGQGPLLRACLLTLRAEKHLLFLSLPALCADAWTLRNLVAETGRAYEACRQDVGADLRVCPAEEPMQYVQFSEWQHELLEDEDAAAGKEFWRKQAEAAAAFPALKLPFENSVVGSRLSVVGAAPGFTGNRQPATDNRLPAASGSERVSFEPERLAIEISRETAAKIAAVAEKQGASAEVFLQACWQTLLWRLTAEADIVVGAAFDGRQPEVLESAFGLFAKWLPIHCHFEESYGFSEVVAQIAQMRRAAGEWQDYFVRDEKWAAQGAFFPVGFEFEERQPAQASGGVSFSVYQQHSAMERFNLKLSCHRTGDLLLGELHYHPGRFQLEDAKRLARHFEVLLRSAVEDVEAPIGRMEILDETDRHQLLVAFNDTDTADRADQCIHRLFEEQAARTPDAAAVVFGEQQLSYAELNARANQLARHLRGLGVGPDSAVGLCLERSVEMLVGILGILKAGGAYVPLEPTYPNDRLAFMLAETRSVAILTQERVKTHLPELMAEIRARVVTIDTDWETIARESNENLVGEVTAENLAYVIYTSGSTGRPKGVMIEHRSVANLAAGLAQAVYAGSVVGSRLSAVGESWRGADNRLPTTDYRPLRVSVNAPLTFDASVKQLVQLLSGHTLYILPEEVRPEGNELLAFVRRQGLDVLDCTPAQLQLLLAAGLAERPDAAPKLMLVGGEAMDDATWTFLARNGQTSVYNVYGPTECTVDATVCRLETMPEPSIGRPIANARVYLLDERCSPVPIGVPGELHIGGAGLARGYLSQAGLTAEKFIPDPFSKESGARLYRTGDLARYLPDGSIKFLGRIDHQVKLRGFRIELGEIEAALRQHPALEDSVVVVREDVPGDRRIVAYVVLGAVGADLRVSPSELRGFLRERLPEYMVPSAFVKLDDLPLTRHGKVDRQALPAPESERPDLHAAYVAPRTRIEQTIAAIWQEVLRVEKVGMDDNFFDLGGHSLLMVQVHSRLRAAFSKEISLIEMFRNPTVSALAKYFAKEANEANEKGSQPSSLQRAHIRAQKRRTAREASRTHAVRERVQVG